MRRGLYHVAFLFGLIGYVHGVTAQDAKVPAPGEERDFRPSMIKFSVDAVPLFQTVLSGSRSGSAFQVVTDLDHFFFSLEFGGQETERGETFSYSNKGSFFTVGPDVNMLKNDRKGNSLTFGLRYGQARFEDRLSFVDSSVFGDRQVSALNPDLKARWFEMVAGLNANVSKGFYLGYAIRWKFWRKVKGIDEFAPYDVPGFGIYEDNTGVQFNFYVGYAIRWRDKWPLLQVLDE